MTSLPVFVIFLDLWYQGGSTSHGKSNQQSSSHCLGSEMMRKSSSKVYLMDTWAGPRTLVVFTIFLAMFICDSGLSEVTDFNVDFGLYDPLGYVFSALAIAHHDNSSASQSQKATDVVGADDDITSTETLLRLQNILFCCINPILCAVGCPGNVLCVIVFSRWGCKERVHLCMIVLAILDFFTIITWFGMNFVFFLDKGEERKYMQWTLRQWLRGPHHGFMFSSGCMVALMSVERCICVAFPHRATDCLTTKTMAIIILAINVFVQVICASFTGTVSVTWVNGTVQLQPTEFLKNNMELVRWTQNFAAMFLLPLVTIVVVSVATSVTVWVLKRAKEWETAANKLETPKRSAKVTLIRMLVTVSIIYVVINTTSLILSIARFHWHETFRIGGKYHNTFMALHISYWTLGSVNSVVNFFVYALRSSRFRYDCVKLFPKCMQARAVKALGIEISQISHAEPSTSTQTKGLFTKLTSAFNVQNTHVGFGTPVRPGNLTENEVELQRAKKISVTFVNNRGDISHCVETCQNTDNGRAQRKSILRLQQLVATDIPPTDIEVKIGSTEQDIAKIGALDCIPEVKIKRTASSSVSSTDLPRMDEGSNDERSDTKKAAAQSSMDFNIRDDISHNVDFTLSEETYQNAASSHDEDADNGRARRKSILHLQQLVATDIPPTDTKIGALDTECIPEVQMKRTASSSVSSPDLTWMPEGSNDEKSDISKAAKQSSMDKSIVDETRTPKEKLSVASSGTDYNPSEYSGDVPAARTRNRTISIIEVVFSEESTTDIPA